MKKLVAFLALPLLFSTGLAHAEDPSRFRAPPIMKQALANHVQPAYAAFEQSASNLEKTTTALCAEASSEGLSKARQDFAGVVDAWSRIEWLRTGPVMAENRLERILFYPDRKGTGLKQVQRAIAGKDNAVTDVSLLAGGSVAVQGLGSIEYLLFGSGSEVLAEEPQTHRCRYARAVASNLHAISTQVSKAWSDGTPLATAFTEPAPDNPLFRDGREALNLILGTMIHGLEAVRDIRIGSFLQADGNDRPLVAIYRRSGLTMRSIAANLEGLKSLFDDSDFQYALSAEGAHFADKVRFEFAQSIHTAKVLAEWPDGDIAALLADERQRQKLIYLQLSIRYVMETLNNEIAPSAGLTAGFSFGDGD